MPTNSMSEVIQCLRSALLSDGADLTDGQLVECFVSRREPAALEALVRRYGPMVWGVCRRVLENHHDAEDAFQATFLVLVRKAASVVPRSNVGNWLYGVAHQTALKARACRAKRRMRERSVNGMPEPAVKGQDLWTDLQRLLDQEVSRLPDKYRTVIVLCELAGKTVKETARQLACPEGTVASRLARARTMLRRRLARHGLAVTGGTLAALSGKVVSASVPTSVLSATVKAVTSVATEQAVSSVISAEVDALAEGAIRAMLLNKIVKVTAVLMVLATALIGAGLLSYGVAGENQDDRNDGRLPEVLVQHPERVEAAPMQQFTGRLGKPEGNSIELTFTVDERSYLEYQRLLQKGKVKGPGSTIDVCLANEAGFPHKATFKRFDDRIDPTSGTVLVHATLLSPDRLLLEGMFVRVRLPFGPPEKVLQVPDTTVLADQGKRYLLVVTGEDIVEKRDVSLGAADDNMRIITKGVSANDWIVIGSVGGLNKVVPGTHVKRRIAGDAPREKKGPGMDPTEGPGDKGTKKLWAGMSVNQPLFRAGHDTNLLQFNFALVNEGDKVVDPKIPGYPRLIVNGKELDLSSIPGVGPRDERFKALPPDDNLQFGMGAGRWFDKPGVYTVYWQGDGFRSNEVTFRVMN
jgi:RNA polymerase sigma factor (sigma-70 family)